MNVIKTILKILVVIIFAAFVVLQFFRPDFTNPPIVAGQTLEEIKAVPEPVKAIFKKSCNDCHTNLTENPWYSKIQPSAGFLKDHIDEGRRKLNFSTWGTYDSAKQRRKLAEVCEEIQEKEMPLPSYLWVHWDAKLTDAEVKTICDWTEAERAKMPE